MATQEKELAVICLEFLLFCGTHLLPLITKDGYVFVVWQVCMSECACWK